MRGRDSGFPKRTASGSGTRRPQLRCWRTIRLGVGANHFTLVANIGGYFTRVGELWGAGRQSNVHNVYWLVAAETGYIGLVAFVAFLLPPLIAAIRCSARHVEDPRGDLLLGLGCALLVVYLHSFEEWIFVVFDSQYLLAIVMGLIAGLTQELNYWKPKTVLQRGAVQESGVSP